MAAKLRQLSAIIAIGLQCVTSAHSLRSQSIPRDEYLKFVPLNYPVMVRQTEASAAFHLYGDSSESGYQDSNFDGIDDHRHRVLMDLSVRFAPLMVQNTSAIPMSFRRFIERGASFALFVDTWDLSRSAPELIKADEIDWASLANSQPCRRGQPQPLSGSADCRLLGLLEEFDPIHPGAAYQSGTTDAERTRFKVMFFDFPGEDEKSWRKAYEDQFSGRLPRDYAGFAKIYSHPFLVAVRSSETGAILGYHLILQYWFFYPFNDGGNNHEGDWEHINVLIAPLSRVDQLLGIADVQWILGGGGLSDDAPDRLVIKRVDYYFHHKVIILDYTRPNVYAGRDDWELEVKNTIHERLSEDWHWKKIRYYAYWDQEETLINTHPIAFIGADNKGADQLLKSPGGSNRDSHGTFPYNGLFKDVGPAGAAERIRMEFDHRRYYAKGGDDQAFKEPRFRRGHAESFTHPDKIEIIPDGERVAQLVKVNARARREWAWLVLPVRWGYPAAPSPLSGIIAHAETGNLSPVGPTYNTGWNRIGDSSGYDEYQPHKFSWLFPTSWQDGFANNLGWLNLTGPALIALPPFDLIWRVGLAPFRALLGRQDPTLHPNEDIPYRFVGLVVAGGSRMIVDDNDFTDLLINERQTGEILERLVSAIAQADTVVGGERIFVDDGPLIYTEIGLYLGRRFASENTLRHGRLEMGIDVELPRGSEDFQIRGDLNFWEYSGSIRYNLSTGGLMPFIKAGYGLSWYRVENVSTNGTPLSNPNGPWVRKPTFDDLSSLLPNTWHIGGGIEWVPVRSFAALPKGIDIGVRGEALLYVHKLGLDVPTFFISEEGLAFPTGRSRNPIVTRPVFNVALTLSI